MNISELNAQSLERELDWFGRLLDHRISTYFAAAGENDGKPGIDSIEPPDMSDDKSEYAALVREFGMGVDERVVFILALIPHVRPQALDILLTNNPITARPYSEFGGVRNRNHGAFLPTAETAVYLLAGADLSRRFEVMQLFDEQHYFLRLGLIRIEHQAPGDPFLNASLTAGADALNRVTHGHRHKPDYSIGFPAKLIQTKLDWDDLILAPEIIEDIEHLNTWILRQRDIVTSWDLAKSIKPGYRALFFGPPGTGKTLTATLLGANAGVDVYRIDLSMVVSKYIGETEKNLANVFDQAENKNWILFFDEADALFGKRTQTSNS
ncbi:MAG: ATP-binding protein, partial [Pseudomonadota bacterium]|nr:ATP-binding protein [Pseudomonadota bacterium]